MSSSRSKAKPTNMALYNRVKAEAKRKFKVWPSAYASGWLVQEYKRRGGKYRTQKSGKKSRSRRRGSRKKSRSRRRSSRKKSRRRSSSRKKKSRSRKRKSRKRR